MDNKRALRGASGVVAAFGSLLTATPASANDPTGTCWTTALTAEEIEDGATSEIECDDAPPGRSSVLAVHWAGAAATGASLAVYGAACDGGGIGFAANDPWNDAISSTEHRLCSSIKHWEHAGNGGASQTTTGGALQVRNLTTLNDATSSIQYY